MEQLEKYSQALATKLGESVQIKDPVQLYEPLSYIVSLGGKRLRPILTLMSCEFFGSSFEKAMDAALAVELFHNFSLIHDDIMDNAPLRRGEITVHEKWDLNTGILSGDAMLILAYQLFENYKASLSCQGNIYTFGRNLGIAFQLQDDYLDAFGNPENFGKQLGGDIITNKKTILYLLAMERATEAQINELTGLYSIQPENPSDKIKNVMAIFESSGAAELTRKEIVKYTQKANDVLDKIAISSENKKVLRDFGDYLMKRTV